MRGLGTLSPVTIPVSHQRGRVEGRKAFWSLNPEAFLLWWRLPSVGERAKVYAWIIIIINIFSLHETTKKCIPKTNEIKHHDHIPWPFPQTGESCHQRRTLRVSNSMKLYAPPLSLSDDSQDLLQGRGFLAPSPGEIRKSRRKGRNEPCPSTSSL